MCIVAFITAQSVIDRILAHLRRRARWRMGRRGHRAHPGAGAAVPRACPRRSAPVPPESPPALQSGPRPRRPRFRWLTLPIRAPHTPDGPIEIPIRDRALEVESRAQKHVEASSDTQSVVENERRVVARELSEGAELESAATLRRDRGGAGERRERDEMGGAAQCHDEPRSTAEGEPGTSPPAAAGASRAPSSTVNRKDFTAPWSLSAASAS